MTATHRSDRVDRSLRALAQRALVLRGLDLLWLVALAAYVLAGIDLVPFHGDESTLIFMSRDYHYLVQEHDLDAVLYDPDIPIEEWDEQQLRLLNGTVPKLAIGLAWDIAGLSVDDINEQWAWGMGDPADPWSEWNWNHANGHVPGDTLLRAGRWSSALLTVVAVWAVFGIAWLVADAVTRARTADSRLARPATSRAATWAASLIYVTHPNVLVNGRRSMMEGGMMAFMALTVLVGLMLLRANLRPGTRTRSLWLWAVVLGVTAGTAISCKHTALLAVIPVYGVLLAQSRVSWPDWFAVRRLAVSALVMVLTFLFWNPAWWTFNPEIPAKVIEWRGHLLDFQAEQGRVYGTTYDSLLDRARGLVDSLFWQGPQYFELPPWGEWLAGDIDEYEVSGLAGRLGGPIWAALGLGLLAAGLVYAARFWRVAEVRLVLAWGAVVAVGLVLLTPLDWARYTLPLHAPAAVLAGLGAAWLLSGAARWLSARRTGAAHD